MTLSLILTTNCSRSIRAITDECYNYKHVVDYDRIKKVLAEVESNNDYVAVNPYGYMGKYQFHENTLKSLGLSNHQIKRFLKSPKLQEKAMNKLLTYNYNYFEDQGLFECLGDTINCVVITKEGMLAGAHLLGVYAVEHFMWYNGSMENVYYKGVNVYKADFNGTPLTKYMEMFNE